MKTIATALLCLTIFDASAQLSSIGEAISKANEKANAAVGKPAEQFKAIVGKWKSQATFTIRTSEFKYATQGNAEWTGLMYGSIKPNGQMFFKAANGCTMTGLAEPSAGRELWSFVFEVDGCKNSNFNAILSGSLVATTAGITLDVRGPYSVGQLAIAHSIKGQFVAY